jgi:cobalt-zinc-cadmium efflux system membrane fusion protein
MMKRETLLSGISALLLLAACKGKPQPVEENKQVCVSDSMAKIITIDTAKTTAIKNELTLSGEVSNDENNVVKVFPFSSGQILDVKVSLGDKVTKGQTLAIMRSADVAGNYTDLTATKSDLSIAKRQLNKPNTCIKTAFQANVITPKPKKTTTKPKLPTVKFSSKLPLTAAAIPIRAVHWLLRLLKAVM